MLEVKNKMAIYYSSSINSHHVRVVRIKDVVSAEELKDYEHKHGFEHHGATYVPLSMIKKDVRVLEKKGLVKRVGSVRSLREQIPFSKEGLKPNEVMYRLERPYVS